MLTNKNSKSLNLLIGLAIVILGLSSCYENLEGCLDPDSTNYSIAADIECEDCCTYPVLSLLVAYTFGETIYNGRDTVTNNLGREFVIEEAKVYLSEIVLSDGVDEYRIDETFSYNDNNGDDQIAVDDIVLATPANFRYTIGTFTKANEYTNLQISLGIPESIDLAQSITVTSDHPLVQAGDSLYIADQNQYVNSWILLRQIGVHDTVDTLQISGTDYIFNYDNLSISQARGSSLDLSIKIDYETLIADIDYNTMNKSEVRSNIGDNLKNSVLPNF